MFLTGAQFKSKWFLQNMGVAAL